MNGSPELAAPADNSQLGRYRIIKKLASGGMGEIYLASLEKEEGFAKQLVIKKLLPSLSRNPSFVSMFHNEARVAAQLSHASIVQIFDFGKMEDTHFIAMEWVHGENLGDIVAKAHEAGKKGLPVKIACEIALSVLRGLDYAHRKISADGTPMGLIHRDVAPKNILVSYEGEVKLIDFGLAKVASATDRTENGAIKGSYCYMSPEQVGGEPLDARSDLYSLGLVLFELLTGERLYPAEMGLRPLLDAIQRGDLSYWTSAGRDPWAEIPPDLAAILQKATARNPGDRYGSAREFIRALEEFLREEGPKHPSPSVADYMRELFGKPEALPEMPAGGRQVEKTRVSSGAQQAIARAEAAEAGPVAITTGRATNLLYNSLAALIVVSLLTGVGFLTYRLAIKPWIKARKYRVVRVESDPPGATATVLFDDQVLTAATPAKFDRIRIGKEHILKVESPGFKPYETMLVLQKESPKIVVQKVELTREMGQIILNTEPPGALATLDGKEVAGKTPLVIEGVEVGKEHVLGIARPGFRKEEIPFELGPRETPRFTVQLAVLRANLRVTATPKGTAIWVNGKKAGSAPYQTDQISVGDKLTLVASKPGWKKATRTIGIVEGKNSAEFALEPLLLETKLQASGKVKVLLNEKPVPGNPIPLGTGEHLLRVIVGGGSDEARIRLQIKPHGSRAEGLRVDANVDAKPWAKVRPVILGKEGKEQTTPVSGLSFDKGAAKLSVRFGGGAVIDLSFDVP
ncbi:MAG: serine/threonine-protein kinase [Bdellovibrionota bacterium]